VIRFSSIIALCSDGPKAHSIVSRATSQAVAVRGKSGTSVDSTLHVESRKLIKFLMVKLIGYQSFSGFYRRTQKSK
jgi:hypothetical protein